MSFYPSYPTLLFRGGDVFPFPELLVHFCLFLHFPPRPGELRVSQPAALRRPGLAAGSAIIEEEVFGCTGRYAFVTPGKEGLGFRAPGPAGGGIAGGTGAVGGEALFGEGEFGTEGVDGGVRDGDGLGFGAGVAVEGGVGVGVGHCIVGMGFVGRAVGTGARCFEAGGLSQPSGSITRDVGYDFRFGAKIRGDKSTENEDPLSFHCSNEFCVCRPGGEGGKGVGG